MSNVTLTAELEWYGHGFAVIGFKANHSITKREGIAAFMRKVQEHPLSPEASLRLSNEYRKLLVKQLFAA